MNVQLWSSFVYTGNLQASISLCLQFVASVSVQVKQLKKFNLLWNHLQAPPCLNISFCFNIGRAFIIFILWIRRRRHHWRCQLWSISALLHKLTLQKRKDKFYKLQLFLFCTKLKTTQSTSTDIHSKDCLFLMFARQESPPHERCSTPSCDPGESSCNNEKQTNSFRYLKFHDWLQLIVRRNSTDEAREFRLTISCNQSWNFK